MSRTVNDLKLISKHASIVTTQVEQVLKARDDLLNELNNMLTNENNWTLPEPIPEEIPEPIEPTPEPILNPLRRREVFYFSVLKICKRQRNQ